jgi:hypothetical protein
MLALKFVDIIDATQREQTKAGCAAKLERRGDSGRELRRTRDPVFVMVRFGRMYEANHLHLVFRKPVADCHALMTEILFVPQRHNRCDYSPFSTRIKKAITL